VPVFSSGRARQSTAEENRNVFAISLKVERGEQSDGKDIVACARYDTTWRAQRHAFARLRKNAIRAICGYGFNLPSSTVTAMYAEVGVTIRQTGVQRSSMNDNCTVYLLTATRGRQRWMRQIV